MNRALSWFAAFAIACTLSSFYDATAVAQAPAPAAQPLPMPKPAPVPNARIKQPLAEPAPVPPPQAADAGAPATASPAPAAQAPAPASNPQPAPTPPAAVMLAPESNAPAAAPAPAPPVVVVPPPNYPPGQAVYAVPGQPGQPVYYANYPPPPRPRARLSRGMMITGISILGASYGLAASVGLILVSENNCDGDCQTVGGELLIPVLGPFLAAGTVDNGGSALAMWGIVQAVGLGLMIGGIAKYKASKRRAEEEGYLVLDLERGRSLSFDAAASPKLVGPRMQLRF